jgi:prefoldin subunit 5
MEVNTQRRAQGLREKIPDISKTLDTVQFLQSRDEGAEDLETYFELNDTLFAKAKVQKTEEVYLWLGANVMLAYPMDEAEELLKGKLEAAKSGLENAEEDMDFLREQITVSPALFTLKCKVDLDKRLTKLGYRRSRSLLLVSTTGMSVCAERKRLRARPLNPAIEVVDHEKQRHFECLIHPHSAVYSQLRKRRNAGAGKPSMHRTQEERLCEDHRCSLTSLISTPR